MSFLYGAQNFGFELHQSSAKLIIGTAQERREVLRQRIDA